MNQNLPQSRSALFVHRREVLAGLGALGIADNAYASGALRTEAPTLVPAARLDAEVRRAWPRFDPDGVLPPFDAGKMGARNDVVLRRIVTTTKIPETGEVVEMSGLLAVPAGARGRVPVVSWQHGTILSFDQVPSNLTRLIVPAYTLSDAADSLETLFNVHRFAANGFAVIAADYLGKGPLRRGRVEAYGIRRATTQTCRDVLRAGLAALRAQKLEPARLFLNGWSQGAINTQWLHQALRQDGVRIDATQVASPFSDLSEGWHFWTGREAFPLPEGVAAYPAMPAWISLCMIIALGSAERYYGLAGLIESAVRPEFHAMARRYCHDFSIDPAAPFPSSTTLLVDGFFDRFTDERNSAFLRHLAEGRTSYWHYDSPIRFAYGLVDEALHPAMVARPLAAGGRLASGMPIRGANHRATFLAGLYGDPAILAGQSNALDWFKRLS